MLVYWTTTDYGSEIDDALVVEGCGLGSAFRME